MENPTKKRKVIDLAPEPNDTLRSLFRVPEGMPLASWQQDVLDHEKLLKEHIDDKLKYEATSSLRQLVTSFMEELEKKTNMIASMEEEILAKSNGEAGAPPPTNGNSSASSSSSSPAPKPEAAAQKQSIAEMTGGFVPPQGGTVTTNRVRRKVVVKKAAPKPSASSSSSSSSSSTSANGAASASASVLPGDGLEVEAPMICALDKVQLLSPGGRYRMEFYKTHIRLQPQSKLGKPDCPETIVPTKFLTHLVTVPRLGPKNEVVCYHSSKSFTHGKKELDTVVAQFKLGETLEAKLETDPGAALSGDPFTVLHRLLTEHQSVARPGGVTVLKPDSEVFTSDGEKCAFPCYVKDVHNGHLYPLAAGLLFLQKPVLFFPDEKIHELKFGRFGVAGARYVDLELTVKGVAHKFSMIDKKEQDSLRSYAAHLAANREKRAKLGITTTADAGGDEQPPVDEDDDEEEEEDESYDPEDVAESSWAKRNDTLDEEYESEMEEGDIEDSDEDGDDEGDDEDMDDEDVDMDDDEE